MTPANGAPGRRTRARARVSTRTRFSIAGLIAWTVVTAPLVVGARAVDARAATRADALARGVRAFRAGDYAQAQEALGKAVGRGHDAPARKSVGGKSTAGDAGVDDWALYLRGESAFFVGDWPAAREDFERLARDKRSRFVVVAGFRAADCLWSAGARTEAADRYRRLLAHLSARDAATVDVAVPRFRVALDAEARHVAEAPRLFEAIYRELPAHPLSTEARKHLPATATADPTPSEGGGAEDRLHRAEILTRDRHWSEALDELQKLPQALPPPLAVERDYQIGMTKFQMRRDYATAAQLLLAAVPSLTGDQAASALFHGTRALSRIDRDDEAIAGYKQVVARFPRSRFAAEAQFLSGWLDYNRGRMRESLPGLLATLEHFGKSAFADDAAWCVAFAHFLIGELPAASTALERYARMPVTGMSADERTARVVYWRARIAAKMGRADEAKATYLDVNRRWPFSFYGVAARARLLEAGAPTPVALTASPGDPQGVGPSLAASLSKRAASDPTVSRADELAAAGLDVEAGWELQRDEKEILRRLGDAPGMQVLLDRYPRFKAFRRAYELGESRNGGALSRAPAGPARVWWEVAYPRAYRELVERFGPPAGNPDLFLYAIMRKESGFSPWDTSTADARGLLQMIPPTSGRVAASEGIEFSADDLYDPELNVRLGAAYIGALARKFGGQIPLVAGAYNAGPKAMAKWCDQHGQHPMDEFVELIAFTQTREYAKRVVGIFARYRQLYGPTPYQMPLVVDPKYASTGPDY